MNNNRNRPPVYDSFFERYHDFSMFSSAGDNPKVDNNRERVEKIDPDKRMPVDQYSSQEFATSIHGWPLSDLALLAKAQTQKEFELAVSRIRELGLSGVNNEGKSVREVLDNVLPSWVKTPAEFQRYAAYYSSFSPVVETVDVSDGNDDDSDESPDK